MTTFKINEVYKGTYFYFMYGEVTGYNDPKYSPKFELLIPIETNLYNEDEVKDALEDAWGRELHKREQDRQLHSYVGRMI